MKAYLSKTMTGFAPADEATAEWHRKMKLGQVVQGKYTKVRNYAFLKKYFALLNVGFENWNPGEINSKFGVPEKNFKQFRSDVTILAGYFIVLIRLDGSTRIDPKSISFAKMEEEDFEKLYSSTIDVLLKYVYKNNKDMDAEKLNQLVEQILLFA